MRIPVLLLLAVCAQAQNPAVDRVFAALDKKDSPRCSLVVRRAGKVVYTHGYGMADLDHDLPITPASVFHVASISKQFTAAAILLPDFGVKITLRHLLHYTSGIRDQWSLLSLAGWWAHSDGTSPKTRPAP